MADQAQPLSDEERAELEALRAEKAERERQEQAVRERAELEALRAERAQAQQSQAVRQPRPAARVARRAGDAEDRRIREQRERGAQLMEPDDDLRMPLGQKVVLAVLALLVLIVIGMNFLVG